MRGNLMGAVVGAVAAGALLTACGGGSDSGAAAAGSSADSSSASSSASSSDGAAASGTSTDTGSATQTVEVKATEYAFGLPTTHFAPGTYTFVMKDDGHATHAITIDGPGVDNKSSATSGPGGTASLTVTLRNGNYVLYCPVGNHRALGMQTDLTVG